MFPHLNRKIFIGPGSADSIYSSDPSLCIYGQILTTVKYYKIIFGKIEQHSLSSVKWNLARSKYYPHSFQMLISCFLLCLKTIKFRFPKHLLFIIFRYSSRDLVFEKHQLKKNENICCIF